MKYFDGQGNEIAMRTAFTERLERITARLRQMTPEERLAWFERTMYPEPLDFIQEIDGTSYIVRSFFDNKASESIEEKLGHITAKAEINFKPPL